MNKMRFGCGIANASRTSPLELRLQEFDPLENSDMEAVSRFGIGLFEHKAELKLYSNGT
jgi:hypothetical protein